jgi:ABC-type uncharacterized transport system ATPase subunit
VSLTLRSGEIVAIAGVSGNGQVALAELLCGTRRTTRAGAVSGAALPLHPPLLVRTGCGPDP